MCGIFPPRSAHTLTAHTAFPRRARGTQAAVRVPPYTRALRVRRPGLARRRRRGVRGGPCADDLGPYPLVDPRAAQPQTTPRDCSGPPLHTAALGMGAVMPHPASGAASSPLTAAAGSAGGDTSSRGPVHCVGGFTPRASRPSSALANLRPARARRQGRASSRARPPAPHPPATRAAAGGGRG